MRKQAAFILFLGCLSCSGCWLLFGERIDTSPPICQEALRDSALIYGKERDELTVAELLTLQKCGLALHPNYRMSHDIANRDEYPVPKILGRLDNDSNQEYQLMLIENLTELTESDRHGGRMRGDEAEIMDSVHRAVSKMYSGAIKKYAQAESEKLAIFFRQETKLER